MTLLALALLWQLGIFQSDFEPIGHIVSFIPCACQHICCLHCRVLIKSTEKGAPSSSLVIACLRARLRSSLGTIFPRFCLSVFTVLQPFLLQSVVKFVEEKKRLPSQRDGLIGAAIIIYGGIAVSCRDTCDLTAKQSSQIQDLECRLRSLELPAWHRS